MASVGSEQPKTPSSSIWNSEVARRDRYYTGTDTLHGGKIVAADVTRTG